MKKSLILATALSLPMVLGALAPTGAFAQAHAAGYGAELGKTLVVIVPDQFEFLQQGYVQTTSGVKGQKSVGTCDRAQLNVQEANYIVNRHEGTPPQKTEVIVLHPIGFEIPQNIKLGSFRETGPCGPGWRILRGHVIEVGN